MKAEQWAASVGEIVRGYVERKLDDLQAKVAALEARPIPDLTALTANLEVDHRNLDNLHGRVMTLEARPASKDGAPGVNGTSVTVEDVRPALTAWLEAWAGEYEKRTTEGLEARVAALPKPRDGSDGKSVALEDVRPFVDAWLATWSVELQRHADDLLQKAVDRWPKPRDGIDGEDGLGFEDLEVVQGEDLRTFTFKFARGEKVREWSFIVPAMIDRGVFEQGKEYLCGDVVSWGGHMWVVKAERTEAKPNEGAGDWRLAVRRGRDGKGLKGEPGPRGPNGKDGESPRWMR